MEDNTWIPEERNFDFNLWKLRHQLAQKDQLFIDSSNTSPEMSINYQTYLSLIYGTGANMPSSQATPPGMTFANFQEKDFKELHTMSQMSMGSSIPNMGSGSLGNMGGSLANSPIPGHEKEHELEAAELRILNFELQRRDNIIFHQQNRIMELEKALAMDKSVMESMFSKFHRADPIPATLPKWAISKTSRYWSEDEHQKFLEAVEKFGIKNSKSIAEHVGSRTATQVRTHAQKYYKKRSKERSDTDVDQKMHSKPTISNLRTSTKSENVDSSKNSDGLDSESSSSTESAFQPTKKGMGNSFSVKKEEKDSMDSGDEECSRSKKRRIGSGMTVNTLDMPDFAMESVDRMFNLEDF